MKLLHFRFVTDMGQNVTCSRLEDKCNFTGSEQNREGVLVFLFFSSSLEIDSLVFESGRTNCMLNVVECQSSVLEEVQND